MSDHDLHQLREDFVKHSLADAESFKGIRDGQAEIMRMLTPIHKAFKFRADLGEASKGWLIMTTKICGLIIAVGTVITLMWTIFGYLVSKIK